MSRPRVILWRHGRTSWNVEYRWQGHSDIGLDEVGLLQAEVAAQQLATYQPSLIVASDLKRAHRTAQFLADITGAPLVVDALTGDVPDTLKTPVFAIVTAVEPL